MSDIYLKSLAALLFIISLILVLAIISRKLNIAHINPLNKRISVDEIKYIDQKNKLVLIKRDNKNHLILINQNNIFLVESFNDEKNS